MTAADTGGFSNSPKTPKTGRVASSVDEDEQRQVKFERQIKVTIGALILR